MIEIGSGALRAAINPLGAELSSLRDAAGRELMTDADPAYWTGRAPLLFPIVGRLNGDRYRLGGREYRMAQHGFARRRMFELVTQETSRAVFRLGDDEETRVAYPFAFALEAAFALAEATLSIDVTVTNTGARDMPASFGFHPAFAWPLPYGRERAAHRIVFEKDESEALRIIGPDGGILPERRPSPLDERVLHLADDLFTRDALIWEGLASRAVRYDGGDGPGLDVAFPDTDRLGIWTRPGAHFVCIEPWHGIADPEGFEGEIWDKPGMMRFAPGEMRTFGMQLTLA